MLENAEAFRVFDPSNHRGVGRIDSSHGHALLERTAVNRLNDGAVTILKRVRLIDDNPSLTLIHCRLRNVVCSVRT